jgi:predicted Co/Zn/Cd cation transporter (cation efflux family)
MDNRKLINGLVLLGAELFASSMSSFLEHFAIFGTAIDFTRGLFDGLSVVTFCVAIFFLVRSRRTTRE